MVSTGLCAHLAQPGIVDLAIGEQVGPHPSSDRKQRQIGNAVARPFRKIGQRRKVEGRAADRHQVEADRDRMAGADDLAFDAEHCGAARHSSPLASTTSRAEIVSPFGQRELLPLRRWSRHRSTLAQIQFGGAGISARIARDQRVVHDAVLAARRLVEQIAESRDPVLAVMGGRAAAPNRRCPVLHEAIELLAAAQLFDAEVERIDLVRIDQDSRNPGAAEHRGRGRAGKAAADDRDVGVPHRESRSGDGYFAPGKANKGLAWKPRFEPESGMMYSGYIYPGKISRISRIGQACVPMSRCARGFLGISGFARSTEFRRRHRRFSSVVVSP